MTRFDSPWLLALALLVFARVILALRDHRARVGAFGFSSFSLVAPRKSFHTIASWIPFLLETVALLELG